MVKIVQWNCSLVQIPGSLGIIDKNSAMNFLLINISISCGEEGSHSGGCREILYQKIETRMSTGDDLLVMTPSSDNCRMFGMESILSLSEM
jgi:hypothetical protein